MLKKAVPNLKRWVSGYLVAVMTLMLVFNNSFAFSALAAETASGSNAEKEASASDAFKNSKVSLKNSQKEDVQFLIFSEQSSYEPGETVCLDLYIKNNTDKTITDGLLKIARAKGIEKDSAYFEDMTDLYEAANREEEKPEETTAEETKAEETEEGTSAEEKEELTAESSEEIGLESTETSEITEASENVEDLLPTEDESAVSEEENLGTEVADTEAAEIKDTAAPEPTAETIEREAEETVEEGSAAVEDEESSASAEDEISEDDEEEKEEEDDPERLSELEILPGKTAYINFYYTIDLEIEGMKDQKVDFSFAYTLEDEEGKQTKNTLRETFRYAVDALNLMTVTAGGEKGYVETGKEDEMLLEFDLGLMREVLEEAIEEELEKTENGDASAAEAKRASASELLVGWEDENGERPLGKKDPAVIKNLKCEVETFGVKLDKFKAIPVKDDDNFGTSLKCSFYVSRKTLPGTYYGRVNASYKIKGKSFHTTQGFKVVVKQETGEMELVGKIGDSEIIMTGPVSSFPKANELSLKVSEITQEQQEKVDEALQKKAEEEGSEISQYKALDIKLMADGVETEPEGDVQVRFKNVNLEKVDEKNEAEQEKAEEQSIVKKAVRKVMSLFSDGSEEEDAAAVAETETEVEAESKDSEDGKAEGSEEAAGETGEAGETAENSENIKVLHLDEDTVVANEMKSEVQENGDVVMDTDHFSIYILVDLEGLFGNINVTVQHWARLTYPDYSEATPDPIEEYTIKDENGKAVTESRVKRIPETLMPIYLEDRFEMDNGLKQEIQEISKICIDNSTKEIDKRSYSLSELWILKPNSEPNKANGTDKNDWYIFEYNQTDGSYKIAEGSVIPENFKNNTLNLATDTTIRMVYSLLNSEYTQDVTFYDYNIAEAKDNNENGVKVYNGNALNTGKQGINSPSNYAKNYTNGEFRFGENTLSVGQIGNNVYQGEIKRDTSNNIPGKYASINGTGDFGTGNGKFLNRGNDGTFKNKETKGIVIKESTSSSIYENGPEFSSGVYEPGLFSKWDMFSPEEHRVIGKKIFDPESDTEDEKFQLAFDKKGDTYVLSKVYKNNNKSTPVLKDLEKFKINIPKWDNSGTIRSNNFWPLDNVADYPGKDPKLGNQNYKGGEKDDTGNFKAGGGLGKSDDGGYHNYFFGMRYDFEFIINDYDGPLKFYFRGDDDFWLFIDGKLVTDIGGIHSAIGEAANFAYLKEGNERYKTHELTVIYAERGGTGSTCYMEFTLPNVKPRIVKTEVPKKSIRIIKEWDDNNNNSYREPITVELSYRKTVNPRPDWKKYGQFTLTNANASEGNPNQWDLKLGDFPAEGFEYKIEEVNGSDRKGYKVEYLLPTGEWSTNPIEFEMNDSDKDVTIKNTSTPRVHVKVEKIWEDVNNQEGNRPDKVYMQLQYKKDSEKEYFDFAGENGILILDGVADAEDKTTREDTSEENRKIGKWTGIFADLPYYIGGEAVTYRVRELKKEDISDTEDKFTVLANNGDKLPGKYGDWAYTVSYTDKHFSELSSKQTTDEERNNKLIATTTVTNTFEPKIDKQVVKKWEGVPNETVPTAKIGLFKQVTGTSGTLEWELVNHFSKKETAGNSITWLEQGEDGATEQDFILDLNYNPSSTSCQGEWKNLPKYENGKPVIYGIFEINDSNIRIEIPENGSVITTISGHKYEVIEGVADTNEDVNEHESSKLDVVAITNKYMVDLNISKVIDATNYSKTQEFEFTAIIKKDEQQIKLPNPTANENAGYEVDSEGVIKFKLKADGTKVTIPVPRGSQVIIKENEESHAGYHVSYKKDGDTEPTNGDTFTVDIPGDGTTPNIDVICTNTPGAVLPDTGGPGLLMMSRLGWMLLLLALLMAGMEIQFYGERRNRKATNMQREDTRGFDPDDY